MVSAIRFRSGCSDFCIDFKVFNGLGERIIKEASELPRRRFRRF